MKNKTENILIAVIVILFIAILTCHISTTIVKESNVDRNGVEIQNAK